MRARTLGANPHDAAITAASVLIVVGLLAPAHVSVAALAPTVLVEARVVDQVVTLTFSTPVVAASDTWVSFVDVTRGAVTEQTGWGHAGPGGSLAFILIGGMLEGEDVRVNLREGIPIMGSNEEAIGPVVDFPVTGTSPADGLPSDRVWMRGAWIRDAGDGTSAMFLFGGFHHPEGDGRAPETATDQILRHDPATGETVIMPARFPWGVVRLGVAVDPRITRDCPSRCVYLVPGQVVTDDPSPPVKPPAAMRFNPATGELTMLDGHGGRSGAGIAWGGDAFYSLGGFPNGTDPLEQEFMSTQIWRFDPDGNTWTLLPTRLPFGVAMGSATFDPTPTLTCPRGCVYHVGGWRFLSDAPVDNIDDAEVADAIRFDPVSGLAVEVPIDAPDTRAKPWSQSLLHGGGIWWEENAFDGQERSPRLARLDTTDGSFTMHALPGPGFDARERSAFVTDGNRFWMAGSMTITSIAPPVVPGSVRP